MANRMSICKSSRCVAIPALLLILLCGFSANAGTIVEGNVIIDISASNGATTIADQFVIPILADGAFSLISAPTETGMWQGDVSANGNIDPFTSLAFGVKNVAAVPLEFTFSITLPIAPILVGTLHGGSTGGSVTDFK